tara:strand:+ start:1383 stop:2069 length:687 start_codon:yes stop_codon:yes gene_type:complete
MKQYNLFGGIDEVELIDDEFKIVTMPRCKTCREKFEPKTFNQKNCFKNQECINSELELKRKAVWKKEKTVIKKKNGWETKKPSKNVLQDEINKLARMIDNYFELPCISCGNTNNVKYDGGHRRSVGAYISIRYNLHNVRKQCSKHCNTSLSGNPDGYDEGLIKRHGIKYKDFVKYELSKTYSYVNLGGIDYTEKIKLIRKLIRDFDTFKINDSIHARDLFNKIIGIYK